MDRVYLREGGGAILHPLCCGCSKIMSPHHCNETLSPLSMVTITQKEFQGVKAIENGWDLIVARAVSVDMGKAYRTFSEAAQPVADNGATNAKPMNIARIAVVLVDRRDSRIG